MTPARYQRFFQGALAASFLLLVYMFLPFAAMLLTVTVLVVVSWPVYTFLSRFLGRLLAALLSTLLLAGGLLGGISLLVWFGVQQAADAAQDLLAWVAAGGVDQLVARAEAQVPALRSWLARLPRVEEWTQSVLQYAAQSAAGWVGALVQGAASGSLQLLVGVASMITLYLRGPRLLATVRRMHWLPDEYLDQLFDTFQKFAYNVIVGMVATTTGQGLVAALGFWLAGVPRIGLLGFLVAVCSQVPFVGSTVVWLPVAITLAVDGDYRRAGFVAVWSLALTGTVDNFLKPFIYRQGLNVNAVLVMLALLAGITRFGATGALLGPLLLVLFLTLWTLYERDVLARPYGTADASGDQAGAG